MIRPSLVSISALAGRLTSPSYRPAQAQPVHLSCPCPQERLGARAHRRAGSEHIVDQENHAPDAVSRSEGTRDVRPPLGCRELYLIPRLAHDLYCIRNRCFYLPGYAPCQEFRLVESPASEACAVQRDWNDEVEAVLIVEDAKHQRRCQFFDDPRIAPVLQVVDDLLADARISQRSSGALEAEVHALALVADEGLEGCWHTAAGAYGTPYPGQSFEARPAEQVARPPLAADAALRIEEV